MIFPPRSIFQLIDRRVRCDIVMPGKNYYPLTLVRGGPVVQLFGLGR